MFLFGLEPSEPFVAVKIFHADMSVVISMQVRSLLLQQNPIKMAKPEVSNKWMVSFHQLHQTFL